MVDHLDSLDSSLDSHYEEFPHKGPSLQVGQIPHHAHGNSNPFDILFDPLAPKSHSRSPAPLLQTPSEHQFQYHAIEQNIYNKVPVKDQEIYNKSNIKRRNVSKAPPTVTIIDDNRLRRTGLVISSSASLRNKNSIRGRNKMVQKDDIDLKKGKPKRKLNFNFPVKRKSSLKYSPVLRQAPNFNSDDELRAFLTECNAKELMKEFVPKQMNFYKHKNILALRPILVSERKQVQVSRTGSFNIKQVPRSISHPIPIKKAPKPQHGRTISTLPFQDIVYLKYKNAVFANKLNHLPKFQEMFPNDIHLLSKAELKLINRKLAFEVLIRRTVAAKIEYRLTQNRQSLKTLMGYSATSNSSSSSSSSGGKTQGSQKHPSFDPKLPGLYRDSDSSSSKESIDTEELIQQNASLFSELLPSPQISYTTDIFGGMYFEEEIAKSPVKSTPSPKHVSNELLYINDFNKAYYNKYKVRSIEGLNSNSNVYQLKPMQRSVDTLSSTESRAPISPKSFLQDKKNSLSSTDKSTDKSNRGSTSESQSTTHTSIFKHLESLSSELSLYIKDGDGTVKYNSPLDETFKDTRAHTNEILEQTHFKRHSLSSLEDPTKSFSILIPTKATSTYDLIDTPIEIVNPVQKPQIEDGQVDLKSMKGSILQPSDWAGSLTSHGRHIPSHKRKSQSFGSNPIGRFDTNSTRSMASSRKVDLNYSGTVRSDFSFLPLGTTSPRRKEN